MSARKVRHVFPGSTPRPAKLEACLAELQTLLQTYQWVPVSIYYRDTDHHEPVDTKVLGQMFERPALLSLESIAERYGYWVIRNQQQNSYPDFVLRPREIKAGQELPPGSCIAVDAKSSYRRPNESYHIGLGSFTGALISGYKATDFGAHVAVAFLYDRQMADDENVRAAGFAHRDVKDVPQPVGDVKAVAHESWKLAADGHISAGNNDIKGITDPGALTSGSGMFANEGDAGAALFWLFYVGYTKPKAGRQNYANIDTFRQFLNRASDSSFEQVFGLSRRAVLELCPGLREHVSRLSLHHRMRSSKVAPRLAAQRARLRRDRAR